MTRSSKNWIFALGLSILALGAVAIAQYTPQPVPEQASLDPVVSSKHQIVVQPAPTPQIVVQPATPQVVVQPAPPTVIKTIDISSWAGYHSGDQVRINIDHIIYIRPHTATVNGVNTSGSAIAVWPEGIWYTRELPNSLTARLNAVGWSQSGASALTGPIQP